jgi:lipopolysaccharide transport system permease protein
VTMLENPYLKYLVALCPMFLPIELFRIPMEPVYLHSDLLLISACSGILFLIAGVLYFRKTEGYFADLA